MVCRRAAVWLCLFLASFAAFPLAAADEGPVGIDYSLDVRPLLAERCFVCHGPDEGSRQAGLRLDRRESALAPADSGLAALVPGDPDKSQLLLRVASSHADLRMPPPESGPALLPQEVEVLRRWIAAGAPYADHWSFRPVVRPPLPDVRNVAWPNTAIDRFVLVQLERAGVSPSPPAAPEALVRRLYFDLLGLPPTPDEARSLAADESPDAYERLVDRLLASPHFGERFGRHWLDLAHYADSDGYLGDALRQNAWRYREWVISAINSDLPLDEFIVQQLAGDLLPEARIAERTATGFLRNTLRNTEAGVDLEEYRLKEIVDRVSTVGTAWLGLSLGCAECHSHKYDPISHREFYELFSFFNDADDVDWPAPLPGLRERYEADLEAWRETRATMQAAITAAWPHEASVPAEQVFTVLDLDAKKRSSEQRKLLEDARNGAEKNLREELTAYEKYAAKKPREPAPKVPTVARRQEERPTYVHLRGDYRSRGEQVTPGTPAILPPLQARGDRADRRDLANWLVDPRHPLTARVTMNYLWAQLFGRGIVATVDNFGSGGEAPSHPALLDWLAAELTARQASRKSLVRLLVTSAVYQQSSDSRSDLAGSDPHNKLLSRQNRFRLEAEAVRDAALAASGLLNRKIGGEGIRPPQPAYVTSISRNADWPVSQGSDLYRRGMYIVFRRATPYPMLLTFDAPDSTTACSRRERSNSPLQALTLLNDPVFFTAAQAMGRELAALGSQSDELRLTDACYRCLGRAPRSPELARLVALLQDQRLQFQRNAKAAQEACGGEGLSTANPAEQASWVIVARVLMNLDEFITRE